MAQTIFVCYLYAPWDCNAPGDLGTMSLKLRLLHVFLSCFSVPAYGSPPSTMHVKLSDPHTKHSHLLFLQKFNCPGNFSMLCHFAKDLGVLQGRDHRFCQLYQLPHRTLYPPNSKFFTCGPSPAFWEMWSRGPPQFLFCPNS